MSIDKKNEVLIEDIQEYQRFVDRSLIEEIEDSKILYRKALEILQILSDSGNLNPQIFLGLIRVIARTGLELPAGIESISEALMNRAGLFNKDEIYILIYCLFVVGSQENYKREIAEAFHLYPDLAENFLDPEKEKKRLNNLWNTTPGN